MGGLVLFAQNFRQWIGAKGFIMVLVAALVPLLLTGAWAATHQRDVTASSIVFDVTPGNAGQTTNITGTITNTGSFDTGPFNVTFQIAITTRDATGAVRAETVLTNESTVGGLAAGASSTIDLSWTPSDDPFQAQVGTFVVALLVDSDDTIPEIDEYDNLVQEDYQVQPGNLFREVLKGPSDALGGASGASETVAARIASLSWAPQTLYPNNESVFTAVIANDGPSQLREANVTVHVGTLPRTEFSVVATQTQNVTIPPGGTATVHVNYTPTFTAPLWVEAFVNVSANQHDANTSDNIDAKLLWVERELVFEEPPERLTIKQFYIQIIGLLQIRILIPFIAIFYAAGVIADEREKGNLTYILTRPVPRWLLPVSKFVAGFAVASVAVGLGILLTFFLLLGTPDKDVGLLTTPLLISFVTLIVYGCVFILVSVLFERPYLVGLAIVAWEWLVQVGELIEVDGRPVVAPWVKNGTLSYHLGNAFAGWDVDKGLQWLPGSDAAVEALRNVVLAAIAALVLAAIAVRRREFEL